MIIVNIHEEYVYTKISTSRARVSITAMVGNRGTMQGIQEHQEDGGLCGIHLEDNNVMEYKDMGLKISTREARVLYEGLFRTIVFHRRSKIWL